MDVLLNQIIFVLFLLYKLIFFIWEFEEKIIYNSQILLLVFFKITSYNFINFNFYFKIGRHRCIGEPFAYVQIKTILATFVRTFNLELHNNKFPECDFTTMMVQPKHPMVKYTRVDC